MDQAINSVKEGVQVFGFLAPLTILLQNNKRAESALILLLEYCRRSTLLTAESTQHLYDNQCLRNKQMMLVSVCA